MSSMRMIQEWRAEGHAEGRAEGLAIGMLETRRSDVTKILRLRFPDASYELTALIRGMTDIDQLGRWLEAAAVAPTVDMFSIMASNADERASRRER